MVQATAQEELTLEFMQKLKDSFDGMADTREIQYDEMKWWTRAQLNHYFCQLLTFVLGVACDNGACTAVYVGQVQSLAGSRFG